MKHPVAGFKRVIVGLSILAALAATPAFAEPETWDNGSSWGTVRLFGQGFWANWPPSGFSDDGRLWYFCGCIRNYALVQVYTPWDRSFVEQWYEISRNWHTDLIAGPDLVRPQNGIFDAEINMSSHPCGPDIPMLAKPVRYARAMESVTGQWLPWVELSCS
jgi:hypothetical protein